MEFPWNHKRRYNALTNYFQNKFGERIQKLSVNAGFSCPNRDGTINVNGCSYCNNNAFNPSYCSPEKSISQQIEEGIQFHTNRYRRAGRYLAYFQTYSNTFADINILKSKYEEALQCPDIIGLVIGTRPDCIDDEKLDYLKELSEKYFVSIEYGVESCYNKTLEKINRGHTFEQSVKAIEETAKRNLHNGIHLVFGLPGESREEMLEEANIISKLPVTVVKFHQLQIIKDTAMVDDYKMNPEKYFIFNLDEYIDFIIDFIERLNPEILIERFTAEVPPRFLVKGGFGLLRTDQILQRIEKRIEDRNTWQGRLFKHQ
ncbi:MAG TPA: TIGR01212 family radical SAM protein [Bacteroidales bacterium]|nr:TIGR01212 family radical SAM protein [Bacteroidales bacterium]HPS18279.1 TIGR01212 family radical SAM protein [Bacteroidales bacterium]